MKKSKITFQNQCVISKLSSTPIIESANPDKKSNFRPGPINLKGEVHIPFLSFKVYETKPRKVRADINAQSV